MGWRTYPALVAFLICVVVVGASVAKADCVIPNTLTNGQPADATQVMANFKRHRQLRGEPGTATERSAFWLRWWNRYASESERDLGLQFQLPGRSRHRR